MGIIQLLSLIFSAIFGSGGLCAFIITIIKLNKKSKTYEVRCKLAAEFIKAGVVKVSPEESKQLLIDILEGKMDDRNHSKDKLANKVIKAAKKETTLKIKGE